MTLLVLWACVPQKAAPDADSGSENRADTVDSPARSDTGRVSDSTDSTYRDSAVALPDADGDGYADAAAGGTDCDDNDPEVHPGATELCDEKDWNCDGDPYDNGACSKPQDLGLLAEGTWDGYEDGGTHTQGVGGFVGDLDGDGRDDVALGGNNSTSAGSDYGSTYLVLGAQPLSVGMHSANTASASWHGNAAYSAALAFARAAGDVDGDGNPDLWLPASDYTGILSLALGPPSRWAMDVDITDSDVLWFAEFYRDGFPNDWHPATDGDLNEDGFSDAVFFSQADGDNSDGLGSLYVLYGSSGVASIKEHSASELLKVPCATVYDVAVGDITGDGVPDLLVGRDGQRVTLLDGGDLAADDRAECDAVSRTTVLMTGGGKGVAVVGDWDGDGVDDWVTEFDGMSVNEAAEGEIYLMSGADSAATTSTAAASEVTMASFLGGVPEGELGYAYPEALPDINGDGLPDVGTSRGADGTIIPSGRYSGFDQPLPLGTLDLAGGGGASEPIDSVAPSVGDFDGDGNPDILVGGGYGAGGLGREYLWLGGGIPWDDPSAW